MSPEDTGEPNGIGRPIYRPSAPRVYPVTTQGKLQPDMEQIAQGAEGNEIDAYQSKSPLSIVGKDMGAEAHAEYNDQFGDDRARPMACASPSASRPSATVRWTCTRGITAMWPPARPVPSAYP